MTKTRNMPPPGLCAGCVHAQSLQSAKGSVFWLCRHPELPKYPQLPVRQCTGFQRPQDD